MFLTVAIDKKQIPFRIKCQPPIYRLIRILCQIEDIAAIDYQFIANTKEVNMASNETPSDLELNDDDFITARKINYIQLRVETVGVKRKSFTGKFNENVTMATLMELYFQRNVGTFFNDRRHEIKGA